MPLLASSPIEVRHDEDWSIRFLAGDPVTKAALDLTGYEFEAAIDYNGGSIALTVGNGRIVVTAASGIVEFKVADADNAAVPSGKRAAHLTIRWTDLDLVEQTIKIIPLTVLD